MVSVVITVVHVEVVVAVVSVVVSRDVPLVASGGAVVSGVAVGGGTAAADSVLQTGTAAAVETGGADRHRITNGSAHIGGNCLCTGQCGFTPRRHLLNSQRAETAGTEHGKQTGKSKHTRPPDKIRSIGGVVQAYANQQHGYAETLSDLWILI